jgi:polysaccharide biosynthesis protein PslG
VIYVEALTSWMNNIVIKRVWAAWLILLTVLGLTLGHFYISRAQDLVLTSSVFPDSLGVNIKSANMTVEELDLLKQAGFKWVRFDLAWDIVEKQKGIYEFASEEQNYDYLVQNMNDRGIHVLFLLAYGNPLYDSGLSPYTDEGRQAFAQYAAAAVEHFADHNVIWEIWNEPNGDFWTLPSTASSGFSTELDPLMVKSTGWAALANAAIPAMRRADAHALIIGPALSTLSSDAIRFLRIANDTGALHKLDAISVHPYRDYWPETVGEDYTELRLALQEMNLNMPVFNSEMGYTTAMFYGNHGGKGRPSGYGLRKLSLDQQASYLVRLYLTDLYYQIPITVWYAWPDEGDNPIEYIHNFGIVTTNRQRKPPFYAARTLTNVLNGFQYESRISLSNPKDWLLKFVRNKDIVFALWTEEDQNSHAISLDLNGEYKLVELYGHTTVFNTNRLREMIVTNEPQYIVTISP